VAVQQQLPTVVVQQAVAKDPQLVIVELLVHIHEPKMPHEAADAQLEVVN
jgi:hypothetical protein